MLEQAKHDYGAAVVEHFQALPFERQTDVLKQLQGIVAERADTEREGLLARLAELDALAGRTDARALQYAGDAAGRPRMKAAVKYYNPETGESSTGRGSPAKWLKAKQDAGENITKYLVGPNNPLPEHLQA